MEKEAEAIKTHLEEEHSLVENVEGMKSSDKIITYRSGKSLTDLQELHRWHHRQEPSGHFH